SFNMVQSLENTIPTNFYKNIRYISIPYPPNHQGTYFLAQFLKIKILHHPKYGFLLFSHCKGNRVLSELQSIDCRFVKIHPVFGMGHISKVHFYIKYIKKRGIYRKFLKTHGFPLIIEGLVTTAVQRALPGQGNILHTRN